MENLEEQCEDSVFQVCDARERYPSLCAKELEKCIKFTSEINNLAIPLRTIKLYNPPSLTEQQNVILSAAHTKPDMFYKYQNKKLKTILNKTNNLKAVMEQVNNERFCELNKLLH